MDDGLLRRCRQVEQHLEQLNDEDRPAPERVAFSKQQFAVAGVVPQPPETTQ
jgi:hypothetical protein